MGKRGKKKKAKERQKNVYLDPLQAEIEEHLEKMDPVGYPPKGKKGKKMLQLPPAITGESKNVVHSSFGQHTGQGHSTHRYVESHKHPGDKVVWQSKDGTKKLFAGKGANVNEFSGSWDLIIDLAGNIRQNKYFGFVKEISDKRFDSLRKVQGTYAGKIKSELLSLDWNDMGVPPGGLDFWTALWDMLPEKTLMMCMGGHGRTGTCLASLMIASGEMSYYEAVKVVRKDHCANAIENKKQEDYLHDLYLERLAREEEWWSTYGAEESGAVDQLKLVKDAIAYAKENPPTYGNSNGSNKKDAQKQKTVVSKSALVRASFVAVTAELNSTNGKKRFKIVGDIPYWLRCVEESCKSDNCKRADHWVWTIWDVEHATMSDMH